MVTKLPTARLANKSEKWRYSASGRSGRQASSRARPLSRHWLQRRISLRRLPHIPKPGGASPRNSATGFGSARGLSDKRTTHRSYFIGSSRESLPIVEALVAGWKSSPFIVRPWTGDVFTPSQFPIDDLARQLVACDFAALVLGPDDQVLSRGVTSSAPRDNVLFELGLFMGAIERARTLFIIPRDADVKIPTDILGLNPLRYVSRTGSLAGNLAPVCSDIAALIHRMGPR